MVLKDWLKFSAAHLIGLVLGTGSLKVIIAENRNGRPALHTVFKQPMSGLRKGAIVDLAEVSAALARALTEARKMSKTGTGNIYINIGTHQSRVQNSKGIVAVSRADREI